jgi:hypothetical protein
VAYLADDLAAAVRVRCRIPDGSSVASDTILFDIADQAIRTIFLPLLKKVQSEHLIQTTDVTLTSGTSEYEIPRRAVAAGLRSVSLMDSSANVGGSIPVLSIEDVDAYQAGGSYYWPLGVAVAVQGNNLIVLPQPNTQNVILRLRWMRRPSRLIAATAADQIESVASATSFDVGAASAVTDGDVMDIVQDEPPFTVIGLDLTASISSVTHTITALTPVAPEINNYVCPYDQSPVVQLPVELHAALITAVQMRVHEMMKDHRAMAAAAQNLKTELNDARLLLTPRVTGGEEVIVNRRGPLRGRRWRRWR